MQHIKVVMFRCTHHCQCIMHCSGIVWAPANHFAICCEMLQQATWRSIRGVHRAHKSPRLWQELANLSSLHLHKYGTTMKCTKMGKESAEVDSFSDDLAQQQQQGKSRGPLPHCYQYYSFGNIKHPKSKFTSRSPCCWNGWY